MHSRDEGRPGFLRAIDHLCGAMRKAAAACELIAIEGGGHGMGGWKAPEMQHWKPETIAWLRKAPQAQ